MLPSRSPGVLQVVEPGQAAREVSPRPWPIHRALRRGEIGATFEQNVAGKLRMYRLAGYQVFCWLAIAFITLGGTSSRSASGVLGVGLALTAAATVVRCLATRILTSSKRSA